MTPPPFIAFPLLDAIYEQNKALLAGQPEIHRLLTSILSEIRLMATDLERANAALVKIALDQQAEATSIAGISSELSTLAAQQPALKDLADRLEAVSATADTNAATLAALAPVAPVAPAVPATPPADGSVGQQIPPS